MQEPIYDPRTGLPYKREGDFYIPLVERPEPPIQTLGWSSFFQARGSFFLDVCIYSVAIGN